jgi:photosystem II stability/assembly factor-like uncharacterized protein
MSRSKLFLVALTLLTSLVCSAEPHALARAPQSDAEIKWMFDIKEDNSGTPRGKVYLMVGERKTLIRSRAIGEYHEIDRADYKSKRVPSTAITAASAWWAGQGEDLYVTRRGRQLIVYVRSLAEESAPNPRYRRLKVINLTK